MVKILLDSNGFDATIYDEPLAIVVLIWGIHPQIILMDINMPPFDGRLICKRLKAPIPTLPVLLFSANRISQKSISECCVGGLMAEPFEIRDRKIESMVAKFP